MVGFVLFLQLAHISYEDMKTCDELEVCGCKFGLVFLLSKFDCLALHNETCVAFLNKFDLTCGAKGLVVTHSNLVIT